MVKKHYSSADYYERKLKNVMERLEVDKKPGTKEERDFNYNWDRHGCYVEFRLNGELYRFDHSIEKAKSKGVQLRYGSDAFAQVVLALEDLARMVERGIYELQTWVAGMRYLPPPVEVPSYFRFLGFTEIPADTSEVEARYRNLAKTMHPDAGGNDKDFKALREATERAKAYLGEKGVE